MSVISLAALGFGISTVYHLSSGPTSKQLAAKSIGKTCQNAQREHSCENQVWVDRALNTVLRDDRLQMSTHQQVVQYVKSQYMREASEHPGVRLVAHTIT